LATKNTRDAPADWPGSGVGFAYAYQLDATLVWRQLTGGASWYGTEGNRETPAGRRPNMLGAGFQVVGVVTNGRSLVSRPWL